MLSLFSLVIILLTGCPSVLGFVSYGDVHPTKYAIGNRPRAEGLHEWDDKPITLSSESPILTLDYGSEAAGFPFFDVHLLSSPVQLEVKYTEQYPGLLQPFSDGPWTFSNGLSNTWRVETFNITDNGYVESFFVQGGQRWETVRLLTNSSVEFRRLGFRATSQHTAIDEIPGLLKTSNDIYDRIFGLGGNVVQAACVDAGNAPSTWEITADGALVRGQTAAQSIKGQNQGNYTLSFETKIVRGGTGWRVASSVQPYGSYFVLTSEYPEQNTFTNVNRTLLPPNTLIYNYGWSLVNQSTLATGWNEYYPLNTTIEEGKWYQIRTTIEETGYRIQLDGNTIAFIPIFQATFYSSSAAAFLGSRSPYEGTWGFGGFQDQTSYFKNVAVIAQNGTETYRNSLTTNDTIVEYNVAPLDHSVCLDGAKRDRLVWIGDFYHTVRVIALSTARWDYILGTLDYVYSYQLNNGPLAGFVPISAGLGTRPENKDAYSTLYAGLIDYQDLLLAGIGDYFRYTGDVTGLQPFWEKIKKQAAAKMDFIDPYSGLVANKPGANARGNFLGPVNGSAVTGLFTYALQSLIPLAEALNDTTTADLYATAASHLRKAINTYLWNPSLGTYSLSVDAPSNYSLTGIAWAILSGAANTTQISSSIPKLEELRFGVGYKTQSSDAETPDYQLAPNPSGFLLEALFKSRRDFPIHDTADGIIKHLLDNLWGSMVNNDEYYSGASWEYVHPDGSPGIDFYTSLAHPWGAAPTYILSEYLLGVEATSPGYRTFSLTPMIGMLGLTEVNGTVPTPRGGIQVSWNIDGNEAVLDVILPESLHGELKLLDGIAVQDSSQRSFDETITLEGGKHQQIILKLE